MKIFVSGSKTIKTLSDEVKTYIKELALMGNEFIIGDCYGVDFAVQKYLLAINAKRVTVYCSGLAPRYNAGEFTPVSCFAEGLNGYEFYRVKDIKMAEDADFGLMIWDGKSRGTKNNIEEMKKRGKPMRVFYVKQCEVKTKG